MKHLGFVIDEDRIVMKYTKFTQSKEYSAFMNQNAC